MPVEIGPKCDIKDQAIELNAYQLTSMYLYSIKKILSKNFLSNYSKKIFNNIKKNVNSLQFCIDYSYNFGHMEYYS